MSSRPNKICSLCGKSQSYKNYARHIKTCDGKPSQQQVIENTSSNLFTLTVNTIDDNVVKICLKVIDGDVMAKDKFEKYSIEFGKMERITPGQYCQETNQNMKDCLFYPNGIEIYKLTLTKSIVNAIYDGNKLRHFDSFGLLVRKYSEKNTERKRLQYINENTYRKRQLDKYDSEPHSDDDPETYNKKVLNKAFDNINYSSNEDDSGSENNFNEAVRIQKNILKRNYRNIADDDNYKFSLYSIQEYDWDDLPEETWTSRGMTESTFYNDYDFVYLDSYYSPILYDYKLFRNRQ